MFRHSSHWMGCLLQGLYQTWLHKYYHIYTVIVSICIIYTVHKYNVFFDRHDPFLGRLHQLLRRTCLPGIITAQHRYKALQSSSFSSTWEECAVGSPVLNPCVSQLKDVNHFGGSEKIQEDHSEYSEWMALGIAPSVESRNFRMSVLTWVSA